jgi:hypothetical protein
MMEAVFRALLVASLFLSFVAAESAEDQIPTLAKEEVWGHIYPRRGVTGFEFYRAEFGARPPCAWLPLAHVSGWNGCTPAPEGAALNGSAVVVERGSCSFEDKTRYVELAGGTAAIVINGESASNAESRRMFRMPSGALLEVFQRRGTPGAKITAVLVNYRVGVVLKGFAARGVSVWLQPEYIGEQGENKLALVPVGKCAPALRAHFAPLEDEEEVVVETSGGSRNIRSSSSGATAASGAENIEVADIVIDNTSLEYSGLLVESGHIAHGGLTNEFLLATYGAPFSMAPMGAVLAAPANGCVALTNSAADLVGKLVVVRRGDCALLDKSHHAEAAGAAGLLIANNAPGLRRPGFANVELHELPSIPTAMITEAFGDVLFAAAAGGTLGSTALRVEMNGNAANLWEGIEDFDSPAAWPVHDAERQELFATLLGAPFGLDVADYKGDTQRLAIVQRMYQRAAAHYTA